MGQPARGDSRAAHLAELPIACSLKANEGAERLTRWRALFDAQRPSIRREPDRITIRLAEAPGVGAELEALAAAERACCSFVEWSVVHAAGRHELRIRGTTDGLDAIAALFDGPTET